MQESLSFNSISMDQLTSKLKSTKIFWDQKYAFTAGSQLFFSPLSF